MTIINISLPDTLRQFVEQRISEDGYSDASAYFAALLQAEAQRRELEAKLLEGLASPSALLTKADFDEVRQRVQKRLAEQKQAS